jgi:hypothetical protein
MLGSWERDIGANGLSRGKQKRKKYIFFLFFLQPFLATARLGLFP